MAEYSSELLLRAILLLQITYDDQVPQRILHFTAVRNS